MSYVKSHKNKLFTHITTLKRIFFFFFYGEINSRLVRGKLLPKLFKCYAAVYH